MAIPAKEFVKLEIIPETCSCKRPIEEHPEEQYRISGKPVCSHCYFDALGKEVEQHPIHGRRVR